MQLDESELDESRLENVAGGSAFSAVVAGTVALARWVKKHPGVLPSPSPIRPRWQSEVKNSKNQDNNRGKDKSPT